MVENIKEEIITLNYDIDIKSKKISFFIKRLLDILLSAVGIIVLIPLLIVIFLAIKIDSKGNVIYKQIRVGKNGKLFKIYKFRTMVVNADSKRNLCIDPNSIENFIFQSKTDNRITNFGRILRKTSLDELPQLFNVLIGNMSLVGPRPEIPDVVQYYPDYYKQRLSVIPGITGLAQISGRGEIELGKTVFYDLTYIKNFSVGLDIKILFKTFTAVFKKDGAF